MISFGSPTPLAAPGSSPRVVVEALIHRGELASLELKEAREHGVRTAIIVALSTVLLLLAGFAATIALAAAVWQRDDRGLILGLVALGYVIGAAVLGCVASRRLRDWKPFAETARQFHADCACIQDIISAAAR